MPGILYVVSTPIGNLADITFRAVETLKTCDIIACEDTRHTEKLLTHFQFRKPLIRYDEHTHEKMGKEILSLLGRGKNVSLVTDAGTPTISDPGSRLVEQVAKEGIKVIPIPGPSAVLAALAGSGWGGAGFVFLGFLPRRPGKARRALQEGLGLGKTVVVFESPFRVVDTLSLIEEIGPESQVVVARELTKIHEEFIRGPVKEVRKIVEVRPPKGEAVIMIQAGDPTESELDNN